MTTIRPAPATTTTLRSNVVSAARRASLSEMCARSLMALRGGFAMTPTLSIQLSGRRATMSADALGGRQRDIHKSRNTCPA